MRRYTIPPTIKEKEKVVGGILTMFEFLSLLLGVILALISYVFLSKVSHIVGIIVGIVMLIISVSVAFVKIKGYSLLKYTILKIKFNKKDKILINKKVNK